MKFLCIIGFSLALTSCVSAEDAVSCFAGQKSYSFIDSIEDTCGDESGVEMKSESCNTGICGYYEYENPNNDKCAVMVGFCSRASTVGECEDAIEGQGPSDKVVTRFGCCQGTDCNMKASELNEAEASASRRRLYYYVNYYSPTYYSPTYYTNYYTHYYTSASVGMGVGAWAAISIGITIFIIVTIVICILRCTRALCFRARVVTRTVITQPAPQVQMHVAKVPVVATAYQQPAVVAYQQPAVVTVPMVATAAAVPMAPVMVQATAAPVAVGVSAPLYQTSATPYSAAAVPVQATVTVNAMPTI